MSKATVIAERLEKISGLSLKAGAHSPDSTFCVMEAVAFVAGEPWSDHPECACPVISAFLRTWSDALQTDADRDHLLKPLIPRLVGTRNKNLEERRALMAADWLVRVNTPAWLRLAGLTSHADALAGLPEITSMAQCPSTMGPIEAARLDAAAAWDAAWAAARDAARAAACWDAARAAACWDAARAAARDAARDAARAAACWDAAWAAARDAARAAACWDAARAAARDAAWAAARAAARDAARAAACWDAAWAAARDAARAAACWDAARDAARDAAWDAARAKLQPTVLELQSSAVKLVERMIEAK